MKHAHGPGRGTYMARVRRSLCVTPVVALIAGFGSSPAQATNITSAPGTRFDLLSYSNVLASFDTTRIAGSSGTSENFAFGPNGMSMTVNPVPEPETCARLLAGPGLMGLMARRRKQCAD